MAEFITAIRTSEGDKQIDYNYLAHLPVIPKETSDIKLSSSTATSLGLSINKNIDDAIDAVVTDYNTKIEEVINNQNYAEKQHSHTFDDLAGCILPISMGGTGATTAEEALSNLGVAATSHNHGASDITDGTLAGQVLANATAQQNISTAQIRNISAGTSDLTAWESPLETGTIYFVYE